MKNVGMFKKNPTVTVAVCAYNEEKNIGAFLDSVLRQDTSGFLLKKILVLSDGSSDDTVKIVKSFSAEVIHIIDYKKRVGKSSRLNTIYKNLNTDILVQSDADVIFENTSVLKTILEPMLKDKNVGMCGGNPKPMPAVTITEKAINYTIEAYSQFREKVRGGNNVFSADGRLLCFRREFIQNAKIPTDMIANDMFCYFMCLVKGYRYRFVEKAIVLFRSPQSIKDQIRQNVRFRASPIRMMRYFPKKLILKEIDIPITVWIPAVIRQVTRNPVLCLYIWTINAYCKIIARRNEKQLTGTWQIAKSTKSIAGSQ